MIFNSLTFLLFLLIIVLIYWISTIRVRIWLVFLSSLVFYGFWRFDFLILLFASIITDYYVALGIESTSSVKRKKKLLALSLFINLGLLFYFKYLLFFAENINDIALIFGLNVELGNLEILLPLGISFYTFQTISYSIDVYRGHFKAIKDFSLFGLYVTFFPQLVAGPILRAEEVVNQFIVSRKFEIENLTVGLERIVYGLFLKVVLADNISPLVDQGFAMDFDSISAIDVWGLAFLFGFQIYFDFAGYSHIAIGCAKLLGIKFPENFNFPYIAMSFKEFWKRWHISLSSWIRDYLYLPISGVKVLNKSLRSTGGIAILSDSPRKTRALFLTWAVMGFWHGANWTFVVWGLYHAFLIYCERKLAPLRRQIGLLSSWYVAFPITLFLSMLGWIPFRAESLSDTIVLYSKILDPTKYLFYSMRENVYLIIVILMFGFLLSYFSDKFSWFKSKYWLINELLYMTKMSFMVFMIFIYFQQISQFIYFQF